MELIWALFFVGGGNIQPIDTAYSYDSAAECFEAIGVIASQYEDGEVHRNLQMRNLGFESFPNFGKDGDPTRQFLDSSEERQSKTYDAVDAIAKRYDCIPQKR